MEKLETLQSEFSTALETVAQQMAGNSNTDALTKLSEELDDSNAKLSDLDEKLEQQKSNFLSLSEDYGTMELEMVKVVQEKQNLEDKPTFDPQELEALNSKLSNVSSALDNLTVENESLKHERETAQQQTAAQRIEIDSSKQTIDEMRSQIITLQANTADAENDERLANSLRQREEDIEDVQNILKRLKPLIEG